MKTRQALAVMMPLVLLAGGCPRQPESRTKREDRPSNPEVPRASGPEALSPDTEYGSGEKVPVVVMHVESRVEIPALGAGGKEGEELRQAREGSVLKQVFMLSEERGRVIFQTADFFLPPGTEVRYKPAHRRYVLADPSKKQYWAMAGAEVANLFEGGPPSRRTGYSISIVDTEEKTQVDGREARRSNATIGFDWSVKTRSGEKKGKVKVELAIWHSADTAFKAGWSRMMIDFLTLPFQDGEGRRVAEDLKRKVKFPVKWSMAVLREDRPRKEGDAGFKMVTVARTINLLNVTKTDLASPPPGFAPATGPYEFGEGGQTVREELLAKIPARPGSPPKEEAPPEGKKDGKKR